MCDISACSQMLSRTSYSNLCGSKEWNEYVSSLRHKVSQFRWTFETLIDVHVSFSPQFFVHLNCYMDILLLFD